MLDVMEVWGAWRLHTDLRPLPKPEAQPGASRARRVALLIADGIKAEPVAMASAALGDAGVVPRLIATRQGTVRSIDGQEFEPHATLAIAAKERFDGLVLPDGDEAVTRLLRNGRCLGLIDAQCRSGKPIFVGAAAVRMLDAAGITASARAPDHGFIIGGAAPLPEKIDHFVAAVLASPPFAEPKAGDPDFKI